MLSLYPHPIFGSLRIAGEHRRDFLQRQTTNDLRRLTPEKPLSTVLTSAVGRILDVLTVFEETDQLFALCHFPTQTAKFLKSRIFFMDRVTINDASQDMRVVDLFGQAAARGRFEINLEGFQIPARRVAFEAALAPAVIQGLISAGGESLTPESYHLLRMEAGVPGPGAEISEAYTPLEAGLAHLVADNKGCYTGQEVLARQTTYDKVTRRLAGIKLKALVAPGAEVLAAGKPAGVITSAGSSPRFGPVALAILRRPHHEPGTSVEIGGIHGQVISLPFSPQP